MSWRMDSHSRSPEPGWRNDNASRGSDNNGWNNDNTGWGSEGRVDPGPPPRANTATSRFRSDATTQSARAQAFTPNSTWSSSRHFNPPRSTAPPWDSPAPPHFGSPAPPHFGSPAPPHFGSPAPPHFGIEASNGTGFRPSYALPVQPTQQRLAEEILSVRSQELFIREWELRQREKAVERREKVVEKREEILETREQAVAARERCRHFEAPPRQRSAFDYNHMGNESVSDNNAQIGELRNRMDWTDDDVRKLKSGLAKVERRILRVKEKQEREDHERRGGA